MVRRTVITAIRAAVPGLLIAIALSGSSEISIQIWIGAAAVLIAGTQLWDFFVLAAVEPERRIAAWRKWRWRRHRRGTYGSKAVRTMNLLLAHSLTNPRVHASSLNPRLISLAKHFLPTRRGIDFVRDPVRVADLLGDVAWLVDPEVSDRTPTADEIGRFLDLILDEKATLASGHEHDAPATAT